MIRRQDLTKAVLLLGMIATALTAHALTLPPAWAPAMPYVEFVAGIVAIVTAFLMNQRKDDA